MHRIEGSADFARRFAVSRETRDRLELYAELLSQWQKTINLVAPSTLGDVWHRHFADSAQLLAHADPRPITWLDLGSGAGFPGLVLAILLAENRDPMSKHILIESDTRKAAFLREVARRTGVSVDIRAVRIEFAATQGNVREIECVTARALAPLAKLLDLAAPFFGPNSKGLFLKGREVEAEIEDAEKSWSFDLVVHPSISDPSGRIVVIRNLRVKSEGRS